MGSTTREVVLIIAGLAFIILRKPFVRSNITQQNKTWGFSFGTEELRSSEKGALLAGCILLIYGIATLLGIHINVPISKSMEDALGGILFIVLGIIMIFLCDKNEQYIMHFNGKPAVFHVGGKKISVFSVYIILLSLAIIGGGVSLLLTGLNLI